MKLYSNTNPASRLEFISLIYFTVALFATVKAILTGDNSFYWIAHFVFICLFIIVLFSTNALRVLITQFIGNFGGVCLLFFLFYYMVMAVGYQDTVVSSNHIRYITRAVIPGFLTGFVLFSKTGILSVRGVPKLHQSIRSFLLNTPLLVSLLLCLLLIFFVLSLFLSIQRTDIFLITNITEGDKIDYQAFGGYALLVFIGALKIIHYYLKQKRDYYIIFCFIVILLGFVFSILLALVGSNKELVTVILILLMCVIYAKPKNYLIINNKIRLKILFLISILLLCGTFTFYVSGLELPHLRIFGFSQNTSLLENESLVSRIDIFMNTGIDQLSINPLFGNLGADYIVGQPGSYIHSIISVQSHLGMIGTFLLLGYLLHRFYRLYVNDGRSVLKIITPPILFISFIGTFFTWLVFWFLVGALFAPRKDF